jgi:membrane protease YdiL (CAAX protease family)
MTLHWIDHLFMLLLVAVFPLLDRVAMRRDAARIEAGVEGARTRLYRRILIEEWVGVAVLAAAWAWLGRNAEQLGLSSGGGRWGAAGYGLAALCIAGFVWQVRSTRRSEKTRVEMRAAIGEQRFLMPLHAEGRHLFAPVSITAGVCEEIVYRGFMIAYFMTALDVSFWIAAALSSVAFGLAHAYQGPSGILRTGLVGALFALLYGLTGALWAPIAVHVLMDWFAGKIAVAAFGSPGIDGTAPVGSSGSPMKSTRS